MAHYHLIKTENKNPLYVYACVRELQGPLNAFQCQIINPTSEFADSLSVILLASPTTNPEDGVFSGAYPRAINAVLGDERWRNYERWMTDTVTCPRRPPPPPPPLTDEVFNPTEIFFFLVSDTVLAKPYLIVSTSDERRNIYSGRKRMWKRLI